MKVSKTCLNPSCGRAFQPGHYGELQKICGAEDCKKWYKVFWSQTRKPPRGIPDDVFAKLEQAVRHDPVHHAVLIVARHSGLRKGELLALTWGDVLKGDGGIKPGTDIRRQWHDALGDSDIGHFRATKTRRAREGILLAEAQRELDILAREVNPNPTDRIFPFWESDIYQWFIALQRKLGVVNPETGRGFRFHDLRHSLGLELTRLGRLDLASKALGHSNPKTTLIYAQQSAEEIVADVEQLRKNKALSSGREDKDG